MQGGEDGVRASPGGFSVSRLQGGGGRGPENLSFDRHSAESPCHLLVILLNDEDIVTIKQ